MNILKFFRRQPLQFLVISSENVYYKSLSTAIKGLPIRVLDVHGIDKPYLLDTKIKVYPK